MLYSNKKNDELLEMVEQVAIEKYDGHLSVLRFTSGWKVFYGTPNLDCEIGREQVGRQKSYKQLTEALIALLQNPSNRV